MAHPVRNPIGEKHGLLTVIARAEEEWEDVAGGKRSSKWTCMCECGKTIDLLVGRISQYKSCGCTRWSNLQGLIFGRLKVIERDLSVPTGKGRSYKWICKCECGVIISAGSTELNSGSRVDCGTHGKNATMRPLSYRYKKLLWGGKHNEIEVSLSFEEFCSIADLPCLYCGNTYGQGGIDRLDPKRGYVTGNCAPCCWECNKKKSNMTFMQFRSWIDRVYHHMHKEDFE